jgi:hypothetical protein
MSAIVAKVSVQKRNATGGFELITDIRSNQIDRLHQFILFGNTI